MITEFIEMGKAYVCDIGVCLKREDEPVLLWERCEIDTPKNISGNHNPSIQYGVWVNGLERVIVV